jgi:hypothetical protein
MELEAEFPIRQNMDGTIAIPSSVDYRIRQSLINEATHYGLQIALDVSGAISGERGKTNAFEVMEHYGEFFGSTMHSVYPLIAYLDQIIPGFSRWLNATGFGSDLILIKAMVKWAIKFNAMRAH